MYTVHVLADDGVSPEYRVFATRAAAERSLVRFEAKGFRARIYRNAFWPREETANPQATHPRGHTLEVNVSGR